VNSLAIVIPYRERQAHLAEFLPVFAEHAAKYPSKVPPFIIKIIEQTPGRDFNRGKLNNIGFTLAKAEADYFCFHDVDHLPERADYRAPSPGFWAHLAEKGIQRVIDPRGLDLVHDMRAYTGGVSMFGKTEFERVNGFANCYWGRGPEDDDLRLRCEMSGIALDRRHGRYRLLPHINNGYKQLADGSFADSDASLRNKAH
jgi:beta-1,4-galactosyltransferase 1